MINRWLVMLTMALTLVPCPSPASDDLIRALYSRDIIPSDIPSSIAQAHLPTSNALMMFTIAKSLDYSPNTELVSKPVLRSIIRVEILNSFLLSQREYRVSAAEAIKNWHLASSYSIALEEAPFGIWSKIEHSSIHPDSPLIQIQAIHDYHISALYDKASKRLSHALQLPPSEENNEMITANQ